MSERTVRAYIGLGANVGDARATLTRAVHDLAALPGVRLRAVSRLYATTPVGVTDQPDFHNAVVALDVPAGADPAMGALALLTSLKDAGAPLRSPGRGSAGARASWTWTCSSSGGREISIERPPEARSNDADGGSGEGDEAAGRARTRRRASACSCSRRSPTSPAGSCRPAGTRRSTTARLRQEAIEGPDAVRPIGSWDAARSAWGPD